MYRACLYLLYIPLVASKAEKGRSTVLGSITYNSIGRSPPALSRHPISSIIPSSQPRDLEVSVGGGVRDLKKKRSSTTSTR